MKGVLSFGANGIGSIFDREINANKEEEMIATHFEEVIHREHPNLAITLERRSNNYLSLCAGSSDFLRFKYTDRAKWISIFNYGLSEEDSRFSAQKNKRQVHWKAKIDDISDLSLFDKDVLEACVCMTGI